MKNGQEGKPVKRYQRVTYWIEPEFQKRFLTRIVGFASLAVMITFVVCYSLIWWQDRRIGGTLFFLSNEASRDPVLLNRTGLVLPMLFFSEVLVVVLMSFLGFFYSHRLAGPIHKIKKTLDARAHGETVGPIALRQNDEFKDLADALNHAITRS